MEDEFFIHEALKDVLTYLDFSHRVRLDPSLEIQHLDCIESISTSYYETITELCGEFLPTDTGKEPLFLDYLYYFFHMAHLSQLMSTGKRGRRFLSLIPGFSYDDTNRLISLRLKIN